jgi:hypothetical protein
MMMFSMPLKACKAEAAIGLDQLHNCTTAQHTQLIIIFSQSLAACERNILSK